MEDSRTRALAGRELSLCITNSDLGLNHAKPSGMYHHNIVDCVLSAAIPAELMDREVCWSERALDRVFHASTGKQDDDDTTWMRVRNHKVICAIPRRKT
jgi:hypothetical protein